MNHVIFFINHVTFYTTKRLHCTENLVIPGENDCLLFAICDQWFQSDFIMKENSNITTIRQKAEELHRNKRSVLYSNFSEFDNLKLHHELEVHQIELELQNEELQNVISAAQVAIDTFKESEEKYRLIVENIGEGFGFVNAEEQFLLANKSAELIFGVEPGSLVGKNLDQFVSNEQFRVVQKETEIREQGIRSEYELDIIRPNGEKRTIHVTAVPQKNKEGNFIGTYGIFSDITERKLAEETLLASKQLIEGIINSIPVRIFWKDRNSVYLGCNKIFANDAGFSDPKELIGKDDSQMGWRDQAELYRNGDRQVMESGIHILLNEEPQTTPEGSTIILLTNKIPLRNSMGEINGILGTSMNITERAAAVQEVKIKNEQLSKSNAEKDKFFSIIAHDLRSPFTGFLGLTQLMAEELSSLTMTQIQDLAISMKNSATNLYCLLENLLQWSQVHQGSIPFSPEIIQLHPMVDECLASALEPAKNKRIEITFDIPENIMVFADNNMLQTIIRNLVSNAIKFTPKGGDVSVSAKTTENNNVEMAVRDTGIGMSREMVENLFRPDVKTNRKGTDDEPSTGLGLLLCKEFIENNGGNIWVESEEGKGSLFYFTIPCEDIPKSVG